jgi:hypothetical protein
MLLRNRTREYFLEENPLKHTKLKSRKTINPESKKIVTRLTVAGGLSAVSTAGTPFKWRPMV